MRIVGRNAFGNRKTVLAPRRGKSFKIPQRQITPSPPPNNWSGEFHIYMCGKNGEIFFLSGSAPGVKKRFPNIKTVLHTLEAYRPIVERSNLSFDDVQYVPVQKNIPLHQSVLSYHHAWAKQFGNVQKLSKRINIAAYWTHHGNKIFYEHFADAIFCPIEFYQFPKLKSLSETPRDVALCFATTNPHSSARLKLPFAPEQWEELAHDLTAIGLSPIATGRSDDGELPIMPGWEIYNGPVDEVFNLCLRSNFILGGNSGMTFLASVNCEGPVVMLDETSWPRKVHDMSVLASALKRDNMLKFDLQKDGSRDKDAFAAVKNAISLIPRISP